MDFNLDDPLGDLLSDGSNDSFFESVPKKKTSTPAKPSSAKSSTSATSATSVQAKGKMEDLFGIKDTQTATISKKFEPEIKPLTSSQALKVTEPPKLKVSAQRSDGSTNDDDFLSDLGFDPKKPKTSKANILDDLLGPIEPKKTANISTTRPNTASAALLKDESKIVSRQSTETTESTVPGTYTASLPRPKTAGRRQSITSINDPLGFFGPKDSVETKDLRETPKVKKKGTTADWLGLDSEPKPTQKTSSRPSSPPPPPYQSEPQAQILQITDQTSQAAFTLPQTSSTSQGALLFATAALGTQNALQTLKQQEAEVAIAVQVKNQELALQEMQKRQQDLLVQQESKFNQLLQQQLSRQNQLEATIRSQQERINAHIQLLMTQTVPIGRQDPKKPPRREGTEDRGEAPEQEMDEIQLTSEVKRLELEKLRLEDLLSNINANHEKEIDYMENSHKKQVKVLEDHIQSLESRLNAEIKSLEEFYIKKLETIQEERNSLLSSYETKLKHIQEEHESLLKKAKSSHDADIEILKEDYKRMVENIRQSKLLEFSAVQENASYLDTLRVASNHLESVSGDLQTLKDEMYRKIDLTHKEREMKLELKEKKLEDTERRLKIFEEVSEQEKLRLFELVTSLEAQLSKLTRDSSEEQWTLRQKMASLEAEKAAFEREKQFTRQQLTRDEKRIEELKQLQFDENQRLMQQIQEERQLLLTEKTKLETAKKLAASSSQPQIAQTEAETAFKVAQDATRQADQERERYFIMQRQLESKKRELAEQDNITRRKQDELESTILSIKTKERRIEEEMRQNRLAEQNFRANTQLLHTQMRKVAEREAQLSQDRFALSKERLELQEFKRKLEQNKCSLCRIGEKSVEISKLLTANDNQIESRPLAQTISFTENALHHKVDDFLDQEVYDSLKRMEVANLNTDLGADLDSGPFYGPGTEKLSMPSNTVPTNLLDSEIMTLNFDIKRNFYDE